MGQQNEGQTQPELDVSGLVAKEAHTGDAAGTAPRQRGEQEHSLRDAPFAAHGLEFVKTEENETQQVDEEQQRAISSAGRDMAYTPSRTAVFSRYSS